MTTTSDDDSKNLREQIQTLKEIQIELLERVETLELVEERIAYNKYKEDWSGY